MTLFGSEVCNIDVITCRAGVSGITAFGTGRSGNYYRVIMTVSGKHGSLAAELVATNGTVNYVVVRAFVITVGSHVVFFNYVALCMTLSGNGYGLAADFVATNGTINYAIIRSGVVTIGRLVVFHNGAALGVTEGRILELADVDLTTSRTIVGCIAFVFTSGRCVCASVIVTERSGNFLRYENYATNGAVLTLGETVVITICRLSRIDNLGVTLSGNNGLSYESYATNGAVLTFGKTGLGTSGSNCLVDSLGVTLRGNSILSYESLAANGAMRAFGKTGFGTSRSNCLIGNYGVTLSIDHYGLTAKLFVTNGTVYYVILRSLVYAIGINEVLYDRIAMGVILSCNGLLSYESLATNGAVRAFGKTGLGTVGSNGIVDNLGVTLRGNSGLSYESLAANGAVLTLGKTGFGTSRSNCLIGNYGVTLSIDHYGLTAKLFVTNGTVYYVILRSLVYAIGINEVLYDRIAMGVTLSCNGLLSYESDAANGAVRAFGKTGLGASRSNCLIDSCGVTGS